MALADIQQHIKQKADEKVSSIDRDSESKLQELTKEWEEKLATERERLLEEASRMAEGKLSQAKFKIREKGNTEVLLAKQAVVDETYEKALKKIADLSDADYEKVLEKLLMDIKSAEGTLHTCKEKHASLVKAARSAGVNAKVSDDAIKTVGGFIFKGENVDIDNTFETIIERVREETLIEVNTILFNKS